MGDPPLRVRGGLRRLAAAALVVLLVPLGAGQAVAQSLDELREQRGRAAEERAALEERLDAAAAELDALEVRQAELEAEREQLQAEADDLEAELNAVGELIAMRVRSTFMHGSNLDPLAIFLSSAEPTAALSRAETVQRLIAGDQVRTQELAATRTRYEAVRARLATRTRELEAARERQAEVNAQLNEDLEAAKELEANLTAKERAERERIERERRAREEAAERAAASRSRPSGGSASGGGGGAVSSSGMACPLDHPRRFTNTWGAPRSGGRGHRGTDILGPHGIPVRAITSGTWSIQRYGNSAGHWAILRGDDGNQYWYMHLQSHTVGSGARVSAGQQVGTNGDTGNARGTPHVHFELHPGGGSAVNPYPTLKRVCG
ncbi:MAG TPA: peptidoglycan DD-metalloendopeptidase family protein [Egicoccus sp.]|nr:peptidoglycan DD-metalloendopeptidase family protein [Egicoccus sp.]HSK22321.1 peptidoglycan DD-metalloendopeptidase family protein [Egicoccus sp.]